ncbi:MAG: tyrosine-type recombinase/integrase [Bacteroidales bacterium]|nr:tyrosine-type recombinase/integrase [Bacteroidales bacterium]
MNLIEKYLAYVRDIRRYSEATVRNYKDVLSKFCKVIHGDSEVTDKELVASMNVSELRTYEVRLLESGLSPKTVNLHLSALSGFCRFLIKEDIIASNPVKLVTKPKVDKRLPVFFKADAMDDFLSSTSWLFESDGFGAFVEGWQTKNGQEYYESMLRRLIIALLYSLGLRRAELIALVVGDVDFGRKIVKVRGKGDKMREIPMIASLSQEILLYLKAVETMCGGKRSLKEPLLVTYKGARLYPMYVDRAVKSGLKGQKGITGRKSPHVLRHSLATELMNEGTDIFSIKEMLGHSSLATTQIYTHSSIAQLKHSYEQAHPRAKNGGKNGD